MTIPIVSSLILDVVERYEYVLDLSKDSSSPPFDYGLVAVVDGGEILLIKVDWCRNAQIDSSSHLQCSSANVCQRIISTIYSHLRLF